MKTREEIVDTLYDFTETQKQKFDLLANQILSVKNKKIGIDTFNTLTNCFRELDILREGIMIRLLASMKRGDVLS